jgi:GNAT superfamily N-acetyltransferase
LTPSTVGDSDATFERKESEGMPTVRIRPAVHEDLPTLRGIERASGQRYRDYGLDRVADDEPAPIEVLARYADDGRAWVAVDNSDQPICYILVDLIDGGGHVEHVSVAPDHQGDGVCWALIEQVQTLAISMSLSAPTLTTFGHIPWNRPLHEHLGFRVLSQTEIGPGVRRVRESGAEHSLDPNLRVVMRLDL